MERTIVIVSASVYLILSNTTYYISYVFQAMNETKVASYSTIINRGFYIVPLVVCIFLQVDSFEVYLFFYLAAQMLSLLYCLWKGREFFRAEPVGLRRAVKETILSMKLGIVLTLANVSGMFIMGMARVVIDNVWGIEAFGQVSLSLSIVNFALNFISQAAMVLFPALRAAGGEKERGYYSRLRDGLGVILPVGVLLYAPLRLLVGIWLPDYSDSLTYLAFLFPVCLFEVQTNLTVATFLKVRCEPRALLAVNVAAMTFTIVAQGVAALFFSAPQASVVASVCGIAIRYAIGSTYLDGVYGASNKRLMASIFIEAVLFSFAAYFLPLAAGFACCVGMLCVHFLVNRKEAFVLFSMLGRLS